MSDDVAKLSQALKAADAAGDAAASAQIAAALKNAIQAQPSVMDTRMDVLKGAGSGAVEGAIGGTVGAPGDIAELATAGVNAVAPKNSFIRKIDELPGVKQVDQWLNRFTTTPGISKELGTDYEPQTTQGKFAKAVTGGATAMLPGGATNLFKRAIFGGTTGLMGESGAQVGGEPGRFGGIAVPVMAAGVAAGRTPNAVKMTRDVLREFTPEELNAAQGSANDAAQTLGTRTLLGQGMGTQRSLQDLTAEILSHPSAGVDGRRVLNYQQDLGNQKIDELLGAMSKKPGDQGTANDILAAGDKALQRPEKWRTATTTDLYRLAGRETVDPDMLSTILQRMDEKRRQEHLGGTSDAGRAVKNYERRIAMMPEGIPNAEGEFLLGPDGKPFVKPVPLLELDNIRKEAQKKASASYKPEAVGADITKREGYNTVVSTLNDVLDNSTALREGRSRQGRVTNAMVDPARDSALGVAFPKETRQAGRGNWDEMLPLFGDGRSDVSRDITNVAEHLRTADPQAFPALAKKWMETKRPQDLEGGRRPTGQIGEFVSNVYGAPTSPQRENFRAMMKGVAESQGAQSPTIIAGAEKLMDALEVISRDAGNVAGIATGEMKGASGRNAASSALINFGFRPFATTAKAIERAVHVRTYDQIADALTSPNGVALLKDIADWSPGDVRLREFARGIYRASAQEQGQK